jgi:tRNA (guanine-N7-)-methyltransferase
MAGATMSAPPSPFLRSFGRRRARKLRPSRQALLDAALPRLAIAPTQQVDPASLFDAPKSDLWLEIGFGGGEHLAWQAEHHPAIGFIGCEPFVDGMAALVARIDQLHIANIRVWPDDARALLAMLPEQSVGRAFILFPDPWPKARHHKRRLIQPALLDMLASRLKPGAELRIATDDVAYLEWILALITMRADFRWTAQRAQDWRARCDDWPATRYEAKALAQGRRSTYLRFVRADSGAI